MWHHTPFQASVVNVSCCSFGSDTVNSKTNLWHTGILSQNSYFCKNPQPWEALFIWIALFSFMIWLCLRSCVSNKLSGRCNIMWQCYNGLFMWIGGSRRQKSDCSQAQRRASQPCCSTIWKAARFQGHIRPGGMSFTKWMGLFSGQLSQSQSIMSWDKWAYSTTFQCRGLFSATTFEYVQATARVKHDDNNNNAWNFLWSHWVVITDTQLVFVCLVNSWLVVIMSYPPTCWKILLFFKYVLTIIAAWYVFMHQVA